MSIVIREVTSRQDLKKFVNYPNTLYGSVPQYMPPLLSEDMSDWNPKKNPAFAYCEARCWLAERDGEVVGRIGAILSKRSNEKWNTRRLRFTQVDFIDDYEVSEALFHTLEAWARELGMDEVHGPLGFTDLDREGMLVDGFDKKSMFITYYNYPYYIEHLTRLGYVKDVDWVEFLIDIPKPEDAITEKLGRLSERVIRMNNLNVPELNKKSQYAQYIPQFFELVNVCYSKLYGTVELSEEQIKKYSEKFAPLINPDFACFVMNEKNEMVGFGCGALSIAEAIKKNKGHLFPLGFIDVLHAMRVNDTLDLFLTAVRPDYQNKGVNAIIMNKLMTSCQKHHVLRAETGPQLELNEKIQHQWNFFKYTNHKRRRCFIKKL